MMHDANRISLPAWSFASDLPRGGAMQEAKILSPLIGELYDAAIDPTLWEPVLRNVAAFVGRHSAGVVVKDASAKTGNLAYDDNVLSPHLKRLYIKGRTGRSPRGSKRQFRSNPAGGPLTHSWIFGCLTMTILMIGGILDAAARNEAAVGQCTVTAADQIELCYQHYSGSSQNACLARVQSRYNKCMDKALAATPAKKGKSTPPSNGGITHRSPKAPVGNARLPLGSGAGATIVHGNQPVPIEEKHFGGHK